MTSSIDRVRLLLNNQVHYGHWFHFWGEETVRVPTSEEVVRKLVLGLVIGVQADIHKELFTT